MSFGREVPPWGVKVHSAADEARRCLRAAGERAADRGWCAKYDFVRGCRSTWLVARARARLRVESVLWWMGAVRQRAAGGPARMALGGLLTLLTGALLAAGLVVLSDNDGSIGDAPHAGVKAELGVAGTAQKSAAGDVRGAGHPEDRLAAAAARPPVSPRRAAPPAAPQRAGTPGSPMSQPGLERSSPAPPRLPERRPATAPTPLTAPAPAPVTAPAPAPSPPARERPDRPAAPPPAQEKPDRPANPPPAQETPANPDRPANAPPAQETPQKPAGPPGQVKKEDSAPPQHDHPDGRGNGHNGRPDRP